jgi:hypothetical protein
MKISEFKAALPYMFKANVTPFVWGHAGIGKSSIAKQLAEELGYKYFPFYLGTQSDLGDILGLASFVKDENGSEIATSFAPPKWIKDMIDYCNQNPDSGAIILLDEFNRARRDVLNGMFSLALDKTFHTMKLPDNCHIIAAGNPPTDEYFTTDVNETALMSRFVHIKLEPTFQEWLDYAKAASFDDTLVGFLQEQPDLLQDAKSSFTLPVKVDPRSYERLNRLFKVGTPQNLLEQLMLGIIGPERVVAYKAHLQNSDKPLTGEQVLEGKNKDKIAKWSNPLDIKASLLSITCDNLLATLQAWDKEKKELKGKQADALMDFLESAPKDIIYALFSRIVKEKVSVFLDFASNKKYESRILAITRAQKAAA